VTGETVRYDAETLQERIVTFRDQKVILDVDLSRIYGVATKVLNQAVKRNAERFPPDFLFQLSPQEVADMRSQIVTASRSQSVTLKRGHNIKEGAADPRFRLARPLPEDPPAASAAPRAGAEGYWFLRQRAPRTVPANEGRARAGSGVLSKALGNRGRI